MMTVAAILKRHGSAAVTVGERTDLNTVTDKLVQNDADAAVVLNDAGDLAGIISAYDLIRSYSARRSEMSSLQAKDVMTTRVYTCRPDETELKVLTWMTEKHIRHMPVFDGKNLLGILSLEAAVKYRLEKIRKLDAALSNEGDESRRIGIFTRHLLQRRKELK